MPDARPSPRLSVLLSPLSVPLSNPNSPSLSSFLQSLSILSSLSLSLTLSLSLPLSLFSLGSESGFFVCLGLHLLQRKGWVCQDKSAGRVSCPTAYTQLTLSGPHIIPAPCSAPWSLSPRKAPPIPDPILSPRALWAPSPESISKSDQGGLQGG